MRLVGELLLNLPMRRKTAVLLMGLLLGLAVNDR